MTSDPMLRNTSDAVNRLIRRAARDYNRGAPHASPALLSELSHTVRVHREMALGSKPRTTKR